jgi:hypothetical protein
MANMQTEALRIALEALEGIHPGNMTPMAEEYWNKAITGIKQALAAQPAQAQGPYSAPVKELWSVAPKAAAQPAVQEPVARVSLQWLAEMILSDCGHSSNYTPLLDRVKARIEQWERANSAPTPPAQPAVPDALNPKDENPAYAAGWNDCRAAMMEMMK